MSKPDFVLELYARLHAIEWLLISNIAETLHGQPVPTPREQPVVRAVKSLRHEIGRQGGIPADAAALMEAHARRMMTAAVTMAWPAENTVESGKPPHSKEDKKLHIDPGFEAFVRQVLGSDPKA